MRAILFRKGFAPTNCTRWHAPGNRHVSTRLAALAALHVSSTGPDSSHSVHSEGEWPHTDSDSSALAYDAFAGEDLLVIVGPTFAASTAQRPAAASRRLSLTSTSGMPAVVDLAPERINFSADGLSP